ncbi:hypothetical protein H0H93_009309, partial [Arthromyces matolae]
MDQARIKDGLLRRTPIYVLGLIIHHLRQEDTLVEQKAERALALVFPVVVPIVQERIFHRVILDSSSRCEQLYSIMTRNTHIGTYVRDLVLLSYGQDGDAPFGAHRHLTWILSFIPNLKNLEISIISPPHSLVYFSDLPNDLRKGILTLLPRVISLHLRRLFGIPLIDLLSSMTLKELHFTEYRGDTHDEGHLSSTFSSITASEVETLNVECGKCLDTILNQLSRPPPGPPINKAIGFVIPVPYTPLKILRLTEVDGLGCSTPPMRHINVPNLVEIDIVVQLTSSQSTLAFLLSILDSDLPPFGLERIRLSIPLGFSRIPHISDNAHWNRIDSVLTDHRFSRFREFRINAVTEEGLVGFHESGKRLK